MKAIAVGICDFCGQKFEEEMEYFEPLSGWRMRATGFTINRGAVSDCIPLVVDECCTECFEKVREAVLSVRTTP